MALYATSRHRGRQERAARVRLTCRRDAPLARRELDATRVRSRTQNGAWRRNDVDDGEREILDHERTLLVVVANRVGDLDLDGVDAGSIAPNGESAVRRAVLRCRHIRRRETVLKDRRGRWPRFVAGRRSHRSPMTTCRAAPRGLVPLYRLDRHVAESARASEHLGGDEGAPAERDRRPEAQDDLHGRAGRRSSVRMPMRLPPLARTARRSTSGIVWTPITVL
jgi:hypothetical protein